MLNSTSCKDLFVISRKQKDFPAKTPQLLPLSPARLEIAPAAAFRRRRRHSSRSRPRPPPRPWGKCFPRSALSFYPTDLPLSPPSCLAWARTRYRVSVLGGYFASDATPAFHRRRDGVGRVPYASPLASMAAQVETPSRVLPMLSKRRRGKLLTPISG